jgi:hypothetical protein
MKRIRSMKGLEIYKTSDGIERVGIVYTGNGRMYRESIGDVGEPDESLRADVTAIKYRRRIDFKNPKSKYKDSPACVEAVKVLDTRRAEVRKAKEDRLPYLPPKEREEAARLAAEEAKAATADARAPLVYEQAVKRFILACGSSYARPRDVELRFAIIGNAFNRRHLDEITSHDVRQYVRDRTDKTGPFATWTHDVGLRPAQMDVNQLSALYGFLIEEERRQVENPCSRYRSRRSHKKSEVYRPKRKPVVPDVAQTAAIFDAAPIDKEKGRFSRHLPGPTMRAFLKLCYYTGARPESEACTLTHGDVTFSDTSVPTVSGRRKLGSIHFHDTKTPNGDREIKIHPELEADLKAVMEPYPDTEEKLDAWRALPIFRRKQRSHAQTVKAWDKSSYQKAWDKTLESVAMDHPALARMIVRDFRKTARTRMTDARVPEPTIRWYMGHARNVSQGYYEITDEAAEEAVLALTLDKAYTETYIGADRLNRATRVSA